MVKSYGSDPKPKKALEKPAPRQEEAAPAPVPAPPPPETDYFPVQAKSLDIKTEKVGLSGTKFELCKILNCPNICLMQRKKGPPNGNAFFVAACGNSKEGVIGAGCPQDAELNENEQLVLQMFVQQFNGDVLQAKKFLFLSRRIHQK